MERHIPLTQEATPMHSIPDPSRIMPQMIPMGYPPINVTPLPMGVPPNVRIPPPMPYGMSQPIPYAIPSPFPQPIGRGIMMTPIRQYVPQYPGSVPLPMNPPAPLSALPTAIPSPREVTPSSIASPPVQNTPVPPINNSSSPQVVPGDIVFAPMPEGDPIITTVYVASIPDGIGDNWMKKILACCGPVSGWKRLSDVKGLPLSFGFCIYEKIEGVAIALKVLHGSTNLNDPDVKGLEIYDPVSKRRKSLRLKIDKLSKDFLGSYLSNADEDQFDEKVDKASKELQKVLSELEESWRNGTHRAVDLLLSSAAADSDASCSKQVATPNWDALEDTSEEITAERKELIMQEIITFRQKAAKQIGESGRECEDIAERKHSTGAHKQREVKKRHNALPREHVSHYNAGEELDEEELKLKKKKRVQEQHQCYLERLALWKKDEEFRISFVKHAAKREASDSNFLKSRCESLKESLPKWNHDAKLTSLEDRLAYWSKCYKSRFSERLRDEYESKREENLEQSSPAPSKQEGHPSEEDVREEGGMILGKIMTKEERFSASRKLSDTIPKDTNELSKWDVKWDELDEYIIEKVLHPLVMEKICEFIGSNDTKDLVQFTMELIQNHTPLDKMITDLQMIFDEDAEEIAVSLFSTIIYETEAKLRGLT